MCGRYRLRRYDLTRQAYESLRLQMDFEFSEKVVFNPYNVCPSSRVPVIRVGSDGRRQLVEMQWGFVPSWTKDSPKVRPINARAESVATSGMFKKAFASRRCLIPADGFYEWKGAKPPKQPYFIHRLDDALFAFAGIWERWRDTDTFAILTTAPNSIMAPIHSRMPAILNPSDYELWLDPATGPDELHGLLSPGEIDGWEAYPVSSAVNSPKNSGEQLSQRIAG